MNKPKVVLVACPLGSPQAIPLALPCLAATLKVAGYDVICRDLNVELRDNMGSVTPGKVTYGQIRQRGLQLDWQIEQPWTTSGQRFVEMGQELQLDIEIQRVLKNAADLWAREIVNTQARFVGFSVGVSNVAVSLMLAEAIKKLDRSLITIFGGTECLEGWPKLIVNTAVDYVILGEGESPLLDLLAQVSAGMIPGEVPSLATKETSRRPIPAYNKNLDALPFPDFSVLDLERYARMGSVRLPMFTSVGCIHSCTFCCRRFQHGSYRQKSPSRIVAEFEHGVETYGINDFFIVDSLINARVDDLKEWASSVVDRDLGITWDANAVLRSEMTDDLLRILRRSGCTRLWYGLESGSQMVLTDMRKYAEMDSIARIFRSTHEAGILTTCFLIVGYPTETEREFQQTLEFLCRNAAYINTLYPQSCYIDQRMPLWHRKEKYEIIGGGNGWSNPNSTPEIRRDRMTRLSNASKDVGIICLDMHPLDAA